MEHQLAIAVRKTVSEPVSDALIETGQEDVVQRLLENQGASMSDSAMEYLVEQSQRVDRYQNPLLRRRELNPDLARRMYWWVSAAIRQHILERFEIDPDTLDEAMDGSTRQLLNGAGDVAGPCGPMAPRKLAAQMNETAKLTPRDILQVLRQGEISFFEAMFTRLTGLRVTVVRRILYEPGGEALIILCQWAEFSPADTSPSHGENNTSIWKPGRVVADAGPSARIGVHDRPPHCSLPLRILRHPSAR